MKSNKSRTCGSTTYRDSDFLYDEIMKNNYLKICRKNKVIEI